MNNVLTKTEPFAAVTLHAKTAAELMTPSPVSLREEATVQEAMALLTDKGFSAAPVIDKAGRPVGVLSRTDVIVHEREKPNYVTPSPDYYNEVELATPDGEKLRGFQVENADRTQVRDIMTPVVFSVAPDTPAPKVVEELRTLRVHRLFVVDDDGVLVGVISALDVMRKLW